MRGAQHYANNRPSEADTKAALAMNPAQAQTMRENAPRYVAEFMIKFPDQVRFQPATSMPDCVRDELRVISQRSVKVGFLPNQR